MDMITRVPAIYSNQNGLYINVYLLNLRLVFETSFLSAILSTVEKEKTRKHNELDMPVKHGITPFIFGEWWIWTMIRWYHFLRKIS